MVRRDLFARASLPVRGPRDWDEFYRWARKLTWLPDKEPDSKPGDQAVYGTFLPEGYSAGWHMMPYIWSATDDAEVVRAYYEMPDGETVEVPAPLTNYRRHNIAISDADTYYARRRVERQKLLDRGIDPNYGMSDLEWQLTIDEPAGVHAVEFYRKLVHQPWVRYKMDGQTYEMDLTAEMLQAGQAELPNGEVIDLESEQGRRRVYHGVCRSDWPNSRQNFIYAMQLNTLAEVGTSPALSNLVAVPMPSRTPEVRPAAFTAGHYLAVNATQPDPRVRDAAWKYIRFLTGPKAQEIRVRTYVEAGLAEFIRPENLRSLGYIAELERIPAERRKLWELLNTYGKVEPYCQGFQHVQTLEFATVMSSIQVDRPDKSLEYPRTPEEILQPVCHRVNTMVLGELPEQVLDRREKIGWVVGAIAVGLLVAAFWGAIRLIRRLAEKANDIEGFGVKDNSFRRRMAVVLFLAPALGSVLLWRYVPLVRGSVMAFQDYKIFGESQWVGLKNFVEVVSSGEFWQYGLQTLIYVGISLTMGFFAPIVLAVLLTEVPRGKVLFRTLYYLPAVTTGLVTMFMWKELLYDSQPSGVINSLILVFNGLDPAWMVLIKGLLVVAGVLGTIGLIRLGTQRGAEGLGRWLPIGAGLALGYAMARGTMTVLADAGGLGGLAGWFAEPWFFRPQTFLRDPSMAMFWIVLPTVWAGMGPGCLIYLAALKSIPEAQYEAADLDGAGIWSKAMNVMIPNLHALILINLVGAVVGAMHASQNIFVMTGGGPENSTMTVGLFVWYQAYMFLNFGLATSAAWIVAAMLIGFTLYQLRLLQQMQFRTASAAEDK
jgi:multiple sugar transport system permease protein